MCFPFLSTFSTSLFPNRFNLLPAVFRAVQVDPITDNGAVFVFTVFVDSLEVLLQGVRVKVFHAGTRTVGQNHANSNTSRVRANFDTQVSNLHEVRADECRTFRQTAGGSELLHCEGAGCLRRQLDPAGVLFLSAHTSAAFPLSCDSHQSGLFRLSSYGQGLPSSQLTFPHPAQYFRWNASSHGASMTGRSRKKAPSVSGFFVISSKLFTAKPPLRIDRGFAAAFEVFLYALLCKNGVVCSPLVAVKPARFATFQLPVDGSRCHTQPIGNVRHPVAVQVSRGNLLAVLKVYISVLPHHFTPFLFTVAAYSSPFAFSTRAFSDTYQQ
nr:MAG TPA: hypothetical protein [Caudoviricetes sp.]